MDLREQLQATLGTAYTLERELGGGGMSRVFVADESRLHRKVVVKLLAPELAAGISAERFEREIQLAASLQHANIVPVLSAGESGGLPYFTMPFVEGESLRRQMEQSGLFSIATAVSILRDVARALAYAHDRGVVHRDIKPDNVLMAGGAAVVTDFGIAKAISASRTTAGATLTQMGTSIGTPAYISPEQAAGDPDVDHRADLYSFGCMAYELLAGRPPFVGKTPQRLLGAHMSEVPQDIRELRPDVPNGLADIVMQCLEKEPDARPNRAADVLAQLDGASSSSGQPTMPALLLGGRRMFVRALAVYAAAFVVVAVVAKAAIVAIGLPDWVFPGSLVVMGLGLPVVLLTGYVHHVTRRAMTSTPAITTGGSSRPHGTLATMALKASPHLSWKRTTMGGVYSAGAFIALIGIYMVLRAMGIGPQGSLFAQGALARNEKIVVSDFSSTSADTILAPTVTEAFRTSLGQSQALLVMSPQSVRDVLQRMGKGNLRRVDLATAREIATREGLKALVDGRVIEVGGAYTISVDLVSTQTGEPLASFSESASEAKEILPAIDRLAKKLRARAGESLRLVQSAPLLEQVTTPSLDALKKYVHGSQALQQAGDFEKGIALLEEAISLDTGFAMAYRKLAVEVSNRGGQTARVMDLLQKAFDHRQRLSDAERYLTVGSYYMSGPHQDAAKAISAYESLIAIQPNNTAALNNVGNLYRGQRDFAKAEAVYRRAIEAGPTAAVFYNNLIVSQMAQGKTAEARKTIEEYRKTHPTHPNLPAFTGRYYVSMGLYDSATAMATTILAKANGDLRQAALFTLQNTAEIQGRLAETQKYITERRMMAIARGVRSARLNGALDSAFMDLWYREDRQRGAQRLAAAIAAHSLDSIPAVERPYGSLVYVASLAGQPDRARAYRAAWVRARASTEMLGDVEALAAADGAIAMAEKRYADAVTAYRLADAGPCVRCALPDLAQAYDLAGQPDSAIAVFTRFLETPELAGRTEPQYRAGSLKRLGELWEQKGNAVKAATYLRQFIELWKNADPELQPKVADARRRLAGLEQRIPR